MSEKMTNCVIERDHNVAHFDEYALFLSTATVFIISVSAVWSLAHLLSHLQARQPLSTVRENSNYDIIRAETGTYKAEDPDGASERISAGKGIAETLLQTQLYPNYHETRQTAIREGH